ncbi:MAG TPA: hypothetical protein PLK20_01790 [Paludibacteraceae bacterium]|nr:hypothetical protein [Paludibacteraceae bacterium]
MSQPQFLISYKDLELRPCSPYKGLPKRGKFDVIAQIIRVRGYLYAPDLAWVIANCPKLQTTEMLELFLAAKPTAEEISCVIRKCDFAQTPELLAAFLAAKPTVHQVIKIRKECEYARTPELKSRTCIRCSDPKTWRAHVCHC